MAIALSQNDYWDLVLESAADEYSESATDWFDTLYPYPSRLGQGSVRAISLRDGLDLAISEYQCCEDLLIHSVDREHPLEYTFYLTDRQSSLTQAIPYGLFGSGIAPGGREEKYANRRIHRVSVHLDPEVFRSFVGHPEAEVPEALQHLIGNPNQEHYMRPGQATPAMHIALQQMLHCPYHGVTRRMFLESKVLELMSLLLDQEAALHSDSLPLATLKPDDVDRVHYAKEILLQQVQNPPSLAQLALQVGLNECTLKRGFRQVFGTTAFGYLYTYRLEQARQLLQERRLNVSEVAHAIGFSSCSHLSKAFRQRYGVSPKQYQAQSKLL